MADKFSSHVSSINSPPENIFGVTPDDGANLPNVSRALNFAQSGTVRVTTVGGRYGDTLSCRWDRLSGSGPLQWVKTTVKLAPVRTELSISSGIFDLRSSQTAFAHV